MPGLCSATPSDFVPPSTYLNPCLAAPPTSPSRALKCLPKAALSRWSAHEVMIPAQNFLTKQYNKGKLKNERLHIALSQQAVYDGSVGP